MSCACLHDVDCDLVYQVDDMEKQIEQVNEQQDNVNWPLVQELVGCNINPTKCKLCSRYNHGLGLDWCVLRPLMEDVK